MTKMWLKTTMYCQTPEMSTLVVVIEKEKKARALRKIYKQTVGEHFTVNRDFPAHFYENKRIKGLRAFKKSRIPDKSRKL